MDVVDIATFEQRLDAPKTEHPRKYCLGEFILLLRRQCLQSVVEVLPCERIEMASHQAARVLTFIGGTKRWPIRRAALNTLVGECLADESGDTHDVALICAVHVLAPSTNAG